MDVHVFGEEDLYGGGETGKGGAHTALHVYIPKDIRFLSRRKPNLEVGWEGEFRGERPTDGLNGFAMRTTPAAGERNPDRGYPKSQ